MNVTIVGPNLRDQSKGSFHVHAAGCRHIAGMARHDPEYLEGWTIKATSRLDVATEIFCDIIEENGDEPADYLSDIHFAPCCEELSA